MIEVKGKYVFTSDFLRAIASASDTNLRHLAEALEIKTEGKNPCDVLRDAAIKAEAKWRLDCKRQQYERLRNEFGETK